jgi:hypothetical protein
VIEPPHRCVDESTVLAKQDRVEAAKRAEAVGLKGAADARNPVLVGHRRLRREIGRLAFETRYGAFHLLALGVRDELLAGGVGP